MAFQPFTQQVPTSIGHIHIVIQDPDGINANRSISAEVTILDQNEGVMRRWSGNLLPHLPAAEVTALVNFVNKLRAQAAAELLP